MKSLELPSIGWREWVALPELGIIKLRCKVDTGARTSALHAFYVEEYSEAGLAMVRFGLHPKQDDTKTEVHCQARIHDRRKVTDSGGHTEQRYVIQTPVVLGKSIWDIEITLTNRDTMKYRMLLGRTAIARNFLVDASATGLAGKPSAHPAQHRVAHYMDNAGEEE